MTEVVAGAATDTGRIRTANEDSHFVGETVFAVADGMGGHLAGEVASATALEPVRALDGRVFGDEDEAVAALRDAVVRANQQVSELARDEPTYRGMGTTLTAALVEGRRVHVAHVGDSRAYLLRDGRFAQLTDDHTLVQHLIDEGQITPAEAAVHPQRSIITRAIGIEGEVEVDATTIELAEGDRLLLCSDGLTGVVDDEVIARELRTDDVDAAVRRLVDLANARGGPDNITVVVLSYERSHATAADGSWRFGSRDDGEADWARRMGRFGQLSSDRVAARRQGRPQRPFVRVATVLLGVAVLLVAIVGGGWWLLSRSFYVGVEAGQVTIFQGVPVELGPLPLSWEYERTTVAAVDLPGYLVNAFEEGRPAANLTDARRIVAAAQETAASIAAADDDPATGTEASGTGTQGAGTTGDGPTDTGTSP